MQLKLNYQNYNDIIYDDIFVNKFTKHRQKRVIVLHFNNEVNMFKVVIVYNF